MRVVLNHKIEILNHPTAFIFLRYKYLLFSLKTILVAVINLELGGFPTVLRRPRILYLGMLRNVFDCKIATSRLRLGLGLVW